MTDFSDDFRRAFPECAHAAWFSELGSLEPADIEYVVARRVGSPRHGRPVDRTVVARAQAHIETLNRRILDNGPLTIDALVALADSALESVAEPGLTRQIVDLVVKVGKDWPLTRYWSLAHAAHIPARAHDFRLADARLRQLKGLRPPPQLPEIWYNGARLDQLLRYATGLVASTPLVQATGISPEVDDGSPGELPGGPSLERPDAITWDWLVGDSTHVTEDQIESVVSHSGTSGGPREAEETIEGVTAAMVRIPPTVGLDPGMNERAVRLLEFLAQIVWLCEAGRGTAWSQLALAAASVREHSMADHFSRQALERLDECGPRSIRDLVELTTNLLIAQEMLAEASSTTDRPQPPGESDGPPAHGATPVAAELGLPAALVRELSSGSMLLVAGPELPTARGAPGRTELLHILVQGMHDASVGSAAREQLLANLGQGNIDPAVRLVRAAQLRGSDTSSLEAKVAEIYADSATTTSYDRLAAIPFTNVVSMCWDPTLEAAFGHRSPTVIRAGSDALSLAAKTQGFVFTWLAGDPTREPIALSPREVRARLSRDETLHRFLSGVLQSSTVLFIGGSASDVIDLFDAFPPSAFAGSDAAPPARHFAICAAEELWDVNAAHLRDVYGVELIAYDSQDPTALTTLIERLAWHARHSAPTGGHEPSASSTAPGPLLGQVTLTNIGAFEALDLELSPGWNLLLGNNGCGKSTVLRAIALGLCGDDPLAVESGARLLRSGCDTGSIELRIGASRFRTDLHRVSNTVRVRTSSLTPLQQGGWAVLGFPALRGMSLTTPQGISHPAAPEPRVEDLLPLLRDDVDRRLDDIKQWIINMDMRTRQLGGQRSRDLLAQFFDVLNDLMPGSALAYEAVDETAWDVRVRTDDGVVSIDQLSQGMTSIIAWIGTLLQRMFDIYADSEHPANEGALVLIDELDAHLHPAWQRLLPELTRRHFPSVQYLATSHSPLVAGSLHPGELFVASREPRTSADGSEHSVATMRPVDVDPHGLRADQILASPLFELQTSRSRGFQEDVARYSDLMIRTSRTPAEEAEMLHLRSVIAAAYRNGETAAERAAEDAEEREVAAALDLAFSTTSPDDSELARLRQFAVRLGELDPVLPPASRPPAVESGALGPVRLPATIGSDDEGLVTG